jgi:hypothetical protein
MVVVRKVAIHPAAFKNILAFFMEHDIRIEEGLSHKGLADFGGIKLRELSTKQSRSVKRK